MSCCGNKRADLARETKASAKGKVEITTTAPVENQPRVFEYTGVSSRMVEGVSGKSYFFRFTGDQQEVDYQDSFAMIAEPDVVIIPNNRQ